METRSAASPGRSRVVAVLGPTNTGKTFLAMERMLGFQSGMIGFPLRLLARENYDRAVQIKGRDAVALITGEEKIAPPGASYFLCTVESMPLSRPVQFLAVDEVQMCADADRGHVFTERLLNARGLSETMLMGAETIRPLLRRLIPEAEFVSRPRFSTLLYSGPAKITRLPRRSAVVAFSIADVYAIAELIRRQRGGTAIVLGALSPRTRNAQVAMYQAGEVDYLVATDAIGMGLNLNVDHVAFAATRKFDGRAPRRLSPSELAQIAGRAGRFTRNGTFGTTAEIGGFDDDTVERIQSHRFDPLTQLCWRNGALRFESLSALRASLNRPPDRPGLVRAREADDELVLDVLAGEADIRDLARGADAVRLLWDVCQIPDFGKVAKDGHARLVGQIYRFLMGAEGAGHRLPTDWVARQVDRINRTDGDIEALMQRIANIRTWTYVSHRGDWLQDSGAWQERTRTIEDKLSDALHERLIQRFVDRRTASLVGRMRDRRDLLATVTGAGDVLVEGHFVGVLDGFRFRPDPAVTAESGAGTGRHVTAVALRALKTETGSRLARIEAETDGGFRLDGQGRILWHDAPVARLNPGTDILRPQVEPLASDLLDPGQRERLRIRLDRWLLDHLQARLPALFLARHAAVSGPARGLLYQLSQGLGSLPRSGTDVQVRALQPLDTVTLRTLGMRIGRESLYFPALLKPAAMALRSLLWTVFERCEAQVPPPPGCTSVPADPGVPAAYWEAVGFRRLGPRAVRVDIVERLVQATDRVIRREPFAPGADLANLLGCAAADVLACLEALGYRIETTDAGALVHGPRRRPARRQGPRSSRSPERDPETHSPFAPLSRLRSSR
jgi:ATP-dependent RNA helicase SUPV3L1/SUV3